MNIEESLCKVLIIEPNNLLLTPYIYFSKKYSISRCETLYEGMKKLSAGSFSILLLSASFMPKDAITFRLMAQELLSHMCLIRVIDMMNSHSFVQGGEYYEKSVHVLTSHASKRELDIILSEINCYP